MNKKHIDWKRYYLGVFTLLIIIVVTTTMGVLIAHLQMDGISTTVLQCIDKVAKASPCVFEGDNISFPQYCIPVTSYNHCFENITVENQIRYMK